jgi:hypothetical protein
MTLPHVQAFARKGRIEALAHERGSKHLLPTEPVALGVVWQSDDCGPTNGVLSEAEIGIGTQNFDPGCTMAEAEELVA